MPTEKTLAAKDPAVLLRRIKSEFPKLTWKDYTFHDHGWDHEVIILDGKLVFRFPNSYEYLQAFKDEAKLLKYISTKTSIPIPKYIYYASDQSFGGYALIPGIELTKEVFRSFSQTQQSSIAKQVSDFLSALHSIPLKNVESFNVARENYLDDSKKLRERVAKYLPKKLSESDYALTTAILDKAEAWTSREIPQALIHADVSSAHLIWNAKSKQIGVIDFSDRLIGDPALDFAELYNYGDTFVQNVYSYYKGFVDENFLHRAKDYYKRIGVYLMVDSFLTDKISFGKAKAIFDYTKNL